MVKLYAQDIKNIEDSFLDLLINLPGTKEDKQDFFRERDVYVAKTNYDYMWESLVDSVGRVEAAYLIFEYLLAMADRRLKHLIDTALSDEPVIVSDRDSAVVSLLFHNNGNPKRICQHLLDYSRDRHEEPDEEGDKAISKNNKDADYEYDVALSFAGENRGYVDSVANILKDSGLKVFYDKFEKSKLWGRDLPTYFDEVYRTSSKYCVMFLSEHYAEKAWPTHERQSALARNLVNKGGYILPVRMDYSEIPGIRPTIGYIDAIKTSPQELAVLIIDKCRGSLKLQEWYDKSGSETENETILQDVLTEIKRVKSNLSGTSAPPEFSPIYFPFLFNMRQQGKEKYLSETELSLLRLIDVCFREAKEKENEMRKQRERAKEHADSVQIQTRIHVYQYLRTEFETIIKKIENAIKDLK